ncbi:MAG: alpha/beta hydrolase [Bacteroidia bacterium]|nr:alpha/beta hydrolase [Bacteroidia bacterium]
MPRWIPVSILIIAVLGLVYLIGPSGDTPRLQAAQFAPPSDLRMLEASIAGREAANPAVKPGNAACFAWADSLRPARTRYAILYLHGFSASHEEGAALARAAARTYGCNLFLARLHAHGLDRPEPMLELDADSLFYTAQEALAIARQLGDSVILMGTSTGGTLSLALAARHPDLAGMVLLSPNIRIFDPNAALLTAPWGLQLARVIKGSPYNAWEADAYEQQFWTTRYRLEAVRELQALVEETMKPEAFASIRQPVFLGYYFRDEVHQDSTVSVPAMLEMFGQLGTPDALKRKVAFPDAGAHVIGNPRTSKAYAAVEAETLRFMAEVLRLRPVPAAAPAAPEPVTAP